MHALSVTFLLMAAVPPLVIGLQASTSESASPAEDGPSTSPIVLAWGEGEGVDDVMRAAPVIALAEFDASCPTDCRGGVTQLVVVRALETVRGEFSGRAANFAGGYVCPNRAIMQEDAPVLVVGIVPEETRVQHPDACLPDDRRPVPVQGHLSALRVFPGLEEARRYAKQIGSGVD